MVYCDYCGSKLEDQARYCANCGAPAPIGAWDTPAAETTQEAESARNESVSGEKPAIEQGGGDYSVILVSLQSCAPAAAGDLLEDMLGYTDEESAQLVSLCPVEVAQNLTRQQALYIAQAMTEYGMEVSVRNEEDDYVEADASSGQTVFDTAGSFLGKILTVLGLLGAKNRVTAPKRLDRPGYREHIYTPPKPIPPKPPVHRSRLFDFFRNRSNAAKTQPKTPQPFGQTSQMAPRGPLQTGFAPDRRERHAGGRENQGHSQLRSDRAGSQMNPQRHDGGMGGQARPGDHGPQDRHRR